ncbi:MAG: hypothetical protein IPJ41_13630 [Phycisphaerales bacterium]|nr:hypothetical protein [Phycisphaerales bacterium]
MKAKNLCLCAGLCAASVAVAGGDKPAPQLLGNSINVQPVKIAKARYENGQVVRVGDWMDYGGTTRAATVRVFDCFGDSNSDGFMDDAGGCSLSSSRWWFGTGYCNGFATNDMTLDPNTDLAAGLSRIDLAWYWTCGGFGTEQCVIGVWTQDSSPENGCELDSFDYSGWLLNYGTLSCNPGGYYYSNVDLGTGTWPAPTGGAGSYVIGFLTSSGAALATCAQPMLWGSPNNTGGDPNGPGAQGPAELDDDNPLDGSHTTSECYTLAFGVCPDPLGAMAQFWGETGGDPCAAYDCDNNGVVDTRDFSCFFNLWVPKNIAADCDGNGVVDTRDFTCFLNGWNSCR